MISKLGLEIAQTGNPKYLRVLDSTLYNPEIQVECARLAVTPPGFNYPVVIDVLPYFNLVLNSGSLGLADAQEVDDLIPLPDGIYLLHYSIAPNDQQWIEYAYLKNDLQVKKYMELLCALKLNACEADDIQTLKLKKLSEIRMFMDAAVGEANYCGNINSATELYNYANALLDKLSDSNCLGCK
jgi:hypothetical protein